MEEKFQKEYGKAPNLNDEGRFLRGGSLSQVLTLEGDSVQDHEHIDGGHSHSDAGHTHTDAGHTHAYEHMGIDHGCGIEGCDLHAYKKTYTSSVGKADIQSSKAQIQTSTSNVGKMSSGNIGGETRPVNMRVVWIIKAW